MKSIERKTVVVTERVARLEALASKLGSLDEYQRSPDLRDIAERNLQVALEACLDIGKIIISQEGLREPADNKGIFVVLAEAGIISGSSLPFLLPMAGTRNVLVHGYDKVDDAAIYGVVKKRLGDFRFFLAEIKRNYLDRHGTDSP